MIEKRLIICAVANFDNRFLNRGVGETIFLTACDMEKERERVENEKNDMTVVSRGGRLDLAMQYIQKVKVPTLFIVGGKDTVVIDLNKKAMEQIPAEKKLNHTWCNASF